MYQSFLFRDDGDAEETFAALLKVGFVVDSVSLACN